MSTRQDWPRVKPNSEGLCVPEPSLWNLGAPLAEGAAEQTSAADGMAGTR